MCDCRKVGLKDPTPDSAVRLPVRTCRAAMARSTAAGALRGPRVEALKGIWTKRAPFRASMEQNSLDLLGRLQEEGLGRALREKSC